MSFRWNGRSDALLREYRAHKFTFDELARMIGCTRDEARTRDRELRLGEAQPDPHRVPRPVTRAVSVATRTRRPLIDISQAPSSMELHAARWSVAANERARG